MDVEGTAVHSPPCGCGDEPKLYTHADMKAATNGGLIVGVLLAYVVGRYVVPMLLGSDS